ncbi:MAG: phosphate ABC transporter substrate-binding protein [Anaerolineae bacterium]|nr:MAG: phosphate ABC transporter substrate-binding protein [Anaerolineae bacterium]
MRLPLVVLLLTLLTACTALAPSPNASNTPTNTETSSNSRLLVIGDISDDPAEVIEGTQPLANYLAARLSAFGISSAQVRVAKNTEEMINLLKNGEVDLCFDSTYPATLISDATGAKIILRRWRFGVEEYHAVIFASKASGITRLEELPGHIVVMDAPYSTSGFLLPAVHLLENNLRLSGKKSYTDQVAPDEVGFVFSYDDENTLQWVLSGLAPAGVTDDYHFDKAFPKEAVEQLVVLARTESTPRQVVLVRPGLEEALVQAIKQILVEMDETEDGKAALKPFQTTQFDEFPEGIESALARMRYMAEMVKGLPLP